MGASGASGASFELSELGKVLEMAEAGDFDILAVREEFAKKMSENLEATDDDFEMKRWFVNEIDVNATLVVENGEKVIYARCWLGEEVFLTSSAFQGIVRSLWPRPTAATNPRI